MKKLFAVSLVGLAVGCGSSSKNPALGTTQQPLESLVPLAGCDQVDAYVRDRMTAEVNRYFDQRIKEIGESTYGCSYGGGYEADAPSSSSGSPAPAPPSAGNSSSSSSSSSSGGPTSTAPSAPGSKASESSGTNNQVAGVDEADFVKNDGQFLYVVANGAFRILKAWPANEAGALSKVALEGTPKQLFVEGDRAVIYVSAPRPPPTSGPSSGSGSSGGSYTSSSSGGYGGSACTYGYECVPSGDGTMTKVLVFDISNRAAPVKIRELELSGSLLAARRIGHAVHTVVVDQPTQPPELSFYLENFTCDPQADVATQKITQIQAYESLRQKDLALIAATDFHGQLPQVTEGGASAVAACSGYFRPSLAEGGAFTSIVSFDLTGGPLTTATVVSDPGVVYASETSLYMAVPHQRVENESWYPSMTTEKQASTVHQFRIGEAPTLTGYQASGVVKGRVLNQFSLDEHEQHLRVATSTGHPPDPDCHSTMSVLARQGSSLALTGKVDNIAPTEDIRSVRFDGSRGYVVTFKKTDPLYVFDLGNPAAPSITGELKIPGFSTYMHMMDASHLLTIGYDANDQGDFAWFAGVRLQIFDVSDMKNPVLAHTEVIGTRGSSSEALTNHLAFNYYAPKNILALPMTICEGGDGNGSFGTNMTFAGLMVYDTTITNGFHLKGKVAHPQTTSGYDSGACSQWWTQASSEVKRSVIMDDFVYSISNKRVKVNALANLSVDLANISLEN